MPRSRTLLVHMWPSSRSPNENYITFQLQDDCVVVQCCVLFDAEEGDVDSAGVKIPAPDFDQAVDQLQSLTDFSQKYILRGIKPDSSLTLQRDETNVSVMCHGQQQGVYARFPVSKLGALRVTSTQES